MSTPAVPGGQLGKNAFLQLMVTQMKYQDPLQPQDNSQFLAQLAQFTSLEQMTNVAQTEQSVLQTMQSMQQVSELGFARQLIGTTVQVADSNGNPVTGTVQSVKFSQGAAELMVGGTAYPLSALTQME